MAEELSVGLTVTATPSAPRISISIAKDITSSDLRKIASEATKIPINSLRLIFRGKIIKEENTKAVDEFKLSPDCVIHCMGKPVEQASAAAAPAGSTAAASATAAAGSSVSIQPPTGNAGNAATATTLQAAFTTLRSSNPPQTYMTAVTTLEKILSNIIGHPMEDKYRRVKKMNAAFQKRLGGLVGGDDAMKAAGFDTEVDGGEEVYMMHASAEKWPALVATKAAVDGFVRDAKAAANMSSTPPPMMIPGMGAGAAAGGGMPNFGNMPGMGAGMGGPEMQAAAARMMQDPSAMQAMLQNPMVQNMMRNDPRFANNPAMQQSLEQMANNPAMLQQISQMMQDPNMQQQMQAMQGMMGGGAGGMPGMPPGGFGGMPPFGGAADAGAATGTGQQQSAAPSGNDQDQTEEEMIAEAIRRSLNPDGGGS